MVHEASLSSPTCLPPEASSPLGGLWLCLETLGHVCVCVGELRPVVEVRDVAKAGTLPPSKAYPAPNTNSADAET